MQSVPGIEVRRLFLYFGSTRWDWVSPSTGTERRGVPSKKERTGLIHENVTIVIYFASMRLSAVSGRGESWLLVVSCYLLVSARVDIRVDVFYNFISKRNENTLVLHTTLYTLLYTLHTTQYRNVIITIVEAAYQEINGNEKHFQGKES